MLLLGTRPWSPAVNPAVPGKLLSDATVDDRGGAETAPPERNSAILNSALPMVNQAAWSSLNFADPLTNGDPSRPRPPDPAIARFFRPAIQCWF